MRQQSDIPIAELENVEDDLATANSCEAHSFLHRPFNSRRPKDILDNLNTGDTDRDTSPQSDGLPKATPLLSAAKDIFVQRVSGSKFNGFSQLSSLDPEEMRSSF
ncbi:unnamed protein product [Protopolystoma xenopodis]|uniref:Uncharacterized protein n=1 Tax=Protopolystoma xenopodis TaxID=117903 RepID=A0A3S5BBW9_9PLAT|nr:unnamed protein product [Protopolystoma xenopodis]